MLRIFRDVITYFPKRSHPPLDTVLRGERVLLKSADINDWRAWSQLRSISREYLTPWEPLWPTNAMSQNFFSNLQRRQWREWRRGSGFAFLIFLIEGESTGPLIGGINVNDIEWGGFSKGTLGYWIGHPYAGKGYMTEAGKLVCDFAFKKAGLRRLEASCLPHNVPSKKVLHNLGFIEEGFAKSYLRINGKWEDHILWGKTAVQS